MKKIPLGIHGNAAVLVTHNTLASTIASGAVPVFGTPWLVLLVEQAAVNALEPYLDNGEVSVGAAVNVKHLFPTPPGLKVTAKASLEKIEKNRLVFKVEARDGYHLIAQGVHERFVVEKEKFILRSLERDNHL